MSTTTRKSWQSPWKSAGALVSVVIAFTTLSFGAVGANADSVTQTADLSVWGSTTTLGQPLGFGMDSAGRQYVTSNLGSGIKVFASDAAGDVPPIATLDTGSDTINSIAFDATGGIWASARSATTLYYFLALAPGNGPFGAVSPYRTVTTLYPIQAIGVSPQAKLVIMDEVFAYDPDLPCCTLLPRHIRTYDLPTTSTLGPVNQISVNGSMMDLDMAQSGEAYAGAQIAFDSHGNILVGGDGGNAYLLPKEGHGSVGSSTAMPLKTWGGNATPVGVAFTSDDRVVITTYANDGVGVRIFSANEGGSTPSAVLQVSAASHTNGTRGIGVSPDGTLIKFAALSSDAIGVLALPAAPAPSPSPTQCSSGVEGAGTNPTETLTVTAPPGVCVLSGEELPNAQISRVDAPLSTRASSAPQVTVAAGSAVALVVGGLPPTTRLQVEMRVDPVMRAKASFVPIGKTRSRASGRARVPAFKATRAGTYTIRLSTPAGKAFYLKVKVARKKV